VDGPQSVSTITSSLLLVLRLENIDGALMIGRYHHEEKVKDDCNRNKDLEPALGSRGVTSEVISGKRKPSTTQIKELAEFFGVAPDVFIYLD
jgi:hypothetical protein